MTHYKSEIQEAFDHDEIPVVFFSNDESEENTYLFKVYAASQHYQKLKFFRFKKPAKDIIEEFKPFSLPNIVAILGKQNKDYKIAQNRKKLNTKNLRSFLTNVMLYIFFNYFNLILILILRQILSFFKFKL